jgi:hypothetical protein
MRQTLSTVLAALVLAGGGGVAGAVPTSFSFTGRLADGGVPVDGNVTLDLALYDVASGGSSLWSESHAAVADNGLVSVAMGGQAALDPGDFAGGDLWLAVSVDGQALTPRLQIRSVPYAMRAEVCDSADTLGTLEPADVQEVLDSSCSVGSAIRDISPTGTVTCEPVVGVPGGAIAFFAGSCPGGWTEYTALQGRMPMGMPAGTTVGTTVGTALTSSATTRTIDTVAAHTHTVTPSAASISVATSGSHNHTASSDTTGSAHTHELWVEPFGGYGTYGVSGVVNSTGGEYAGGIANSTGSGHTHGVTVNTTNSSHSHTMNYATFNSGSTGTATVDVTMPYIRLRACQKN